MEGAETAMGDQNNTNSNDQTENNGGGSTEENNQEQQNGIVWETWLAGQEERVRTAYTEHTEGLRSALQKERTERKALATEVRGLTEVAGQTDEMKTRLTSLTDKLEAADRRLEFYEAAGAECKNLRLAWLAAQEIDAFRRDGSVDIAKVKEAFPELFRKVGATSGSGDPRGGQGSNSTSGQRPNVSMNDLIREKAGRRSEAQHL